MTNVPTKTNRSFLVIKGTTYASVFKIKIPEYRQRQYFDERKMAELIASIQNRGLINPITVTTDNRLVTGERRLFAVTQLHKKSYPIKYGYERIPWGQIPAVVVDAGKPEIELEAMELDENIARADLTWHERCEAIARLHNLREREHNGEWTYADTARELKAKTSKKPSVETISSALLVAKHLNDPTVRAKPSQASAKSFIKRRLQEERIAKLEADVREHLAPHDIILGHMPTRMGMCFNRFDVILGRWPAKPQLPANVFGELSWKWAKQQAHLYLICHPFEYGALASALGSAGWEVWHVPLIWDHKIARASEATYGPARSYQTILYAIKGRRRVIRAGRDVLRYDVVPSNRDIMEVPPQLYIDLLRRSCNPGDEVFDPFCGRGEIFPAANIAVVRATSITMNQREFDIASSRMREGLLDQPGDE